MAAAHPGRLSAGLRRTFEALDIPPYRILWWGTLFSFAGMQMQQIARGYLAFDLTGSNTALGGVMIAFGVPQLLLSLYGGAIADRMAKRTVIVIWQTVIAVASALMAIAIFAGAVQYWMLIVTGVITGASFSFIGPARQAFIGDLVPTRLMGNAIVLQQANMNGTRVVGPALAGMLIATPLIGMGGVYALTTVGFIISVITIFKLPLGLPKAGRQNRSTLQDTREGISYVRHNAPIAVLILMSFVVVAVGFPYQGFLASITRDEFNRGALGLGILSSMTAIGALTATLVV
ncbi:MAG: MFS transporter, partial [Dehalococcoidia bacterium]